MFLLVALLEFFLCFEKLIMLLLHIRAWYLFQDQTMSLGAKAWMAWPQGLLSTTSKAHVLPSGMSDVRSPLLILYFP